MPPTNPRDFAALGGVPGAHLGLTWSGTTPADLGEVVGLSRRCEDVDGARVRVPLSVLEAVLAGGPVAMVGRDRAGVVRAAARVRGEGRRVGIRALVDPAWRGRGVGRAVLAWQDRWARDLLGETGPSTIAVPIAAHLVDRRRLYTAAGFSCHARVELHARHLGDAPARERRVVPLTPAPGWTIRPLRPGDADHLALHAGEDPHQFVAAAMTVQELADTCEPSLSLVAESHGAARAALLVHTTEDLAGRPVGWSRALLAEPGADAVLGDLLGTAVHELWAAGLRHLYMFTTPAVSARWRGVLDDLSCDPVDVELLYSIENP